LDVLDDVFTGPPSDLVERERSHHPRTVEPSDTGHQYLLSRCDALDYKLRSLLPGRQIAHHTVLASVVIARSEHDLYVRIEVLSLVLLRAQHQRVEA
jgi:hypothetical protein